MAGPLTKAGRYQIVAELGRGSMGVVYQGFDPVIGRTVAIKTMLIEGLPASEFEEYKQRFQREAQSAGVLTHPNIVTVYDFGEDSGVLYLAMEFLEGKSIQQLVEKHNLMPIETIIPMYEQICSALDHAHEHKIIHRDVKPANIMILESGLMKVMDFGVAKMMSMGMTQAGQILGTPNYMSPEQVKGRGVDGRSDIFSLGVILYELVTGEKPFGGQNITTVIYKIINEDPIPPRQLDSTIHPGLSYVISRALAKNPAERYQFCHELAEDLRNYKSLGGQGAPSATLVVRVPPISTPTVESPAPPPAPPRAVAKPAPAMDEPRRTPAAPPPTPAPRERKPPAPVVYAAQPQQKSSSSVAWIFLIIILAAGAGLGGFYYYNNIYLPGQQRGDSTTTHVPPGGTTPPKSTTTTEPAQSTNPPATQPDGTTSTTTQPGGTTSPATQPGTTSTQPPATETTTIPAVKPPAETPTTPTATTVVPKNGKIMLASSPRGARISVDGKDTRWVTPHPLDLPAGDHEIALSRNGYKAETVSIAVEGGRTTARNIELAEVARVKPPKEVEPEPTNPPPVTKPAAGGEGSVVIETVPSGLDILIDGKPLGKSPAKALLSPGTHTYTFTCPDSDPQTKNLTVTSGGISTHTIRCTD